VKDDKGASGKGQFVAEQGRHPIPGLPAGGEFYIPGRQGPAGDAPGHGFIVEKNMSVAPVHGQAQIEVAAIAVVRPRRLAAPGKGQKALADLVALYSDAKPRPRPPGAVD